MAERSDSRPPRGPIGAFVQLAESAVAMLRTRIELAAVEFAEACNHLK